MTLLVLDIGNTNVTVGFYEGENLVNHFRLATDHNRMPDEYGLQLTGLLETCGYSASDLDGICMASVAPPVTGRVVQACRQYMKLEPMLVNSKMKTGIKIKYDSPESVGADRIADAVAVKVLYGTPACVIDFGTATTFNAINQKNEYLGGAISAGIGIALEALASRTAKLPQVALEVPPSVIGTNTTHAIQSGMVFGYMSLVEGMTARFREVLGDSMIVVATGGLAEVVAKETSAIDFIAPWLTMDGIRILWELNQKK